MGIRLAALTISVGVICFTQAWALGDQECRSLWIEADADGSGSLTAGEADRYLAAIRQSGRPAPSEGSITAPVFLDHCRGGAFAQASAETGAPFPGANSFTEGQAQDRITASGLTGVSALDKDADGIWRGTAKRDGRSVNVAVDYKGNVVVN